MECTKCGMAMKRSKCKQFMMARVSVGGSDGKVYMLTMFNNVTMGIIRRWNFWADVKRKLLSAPAMQFNVDRGDIVYSVQKL